TPTFIPFSGQGYRLGSHSAQTPTPEQSMPVVIDENPTTPESPAPVATADKTPEESSIPIVPSMPTEIPIPALDNTNPDPAPKIEPMPLVLEAAQQQPVEEEIEEEPEILPTPVGKQTRLYLS